jgi:hypothetical protein
MQEKIRRFSPQCWNKVFVPVRLPEKKTQVGADRSCWKLCNKFVKMSVLRAVNGSQPLCGE